MKRTILLALTLMVSASFFPTFAGKKDKKKSQQTPATVALTTSSDTISYAAGMAMTEGLLPFLKEQYGVDEAFIDDFLRGFSFVMDRPVDDPMKAYGAGIQIALMVQNRMLPDISQKFQGSNDSIMPAMFREGFVAALKKDTTFFRQSAASKLFKDRQEAVRQQKLDVNRQAGARFLAENKLREGVKTTESGLQYEILRQGTGAIPTANDEVKVKYEGKLIDGTVFDSSYNKKDSTATFRANRLIKGWTEALTMMPVGSKWKVYIPEKLAYGERSMGKIPACSTLIFTLELDEIVKKEK